MSTPLAIADLCRSRLPGDEAIARRVVAGERDLYEVLIRRNNQRLYRALRSVLRDESEVEEAMQVAYVLAYTRLRQFEGRSSFSTWLVRIGLNAAHGLRRARHLAVAETPLEADTGESDHAMKTASEGPSPEQMVGTNEWSRLLERALDGLPAPYRTVFVLRMVEELSTAETAEALDVSEDVVKTRLHRARALLQDGLASLTDAAARDAFQFDARRCDRIVVAVFERLP